MWPNVFSLKKHQIKWTGAATVYSKIMNFLNQIELKYSLNETWE